MDASLPIRFQFHLVPNHMTNPPTTLTSRMFVSSDAFSPADDSVAIDTRALRADPPSSLSSKKFEFRLNSAGVIVSEGQVCGLSCENTRAPLPELALALVETAAWNRARWGDGMLGAM